MEKVATETVIVGVEVVVNVIPVQNHLVAVLDEIRHVVVLHESIECHPFHHPLKFS
jgi:hypothetical protein